MATYTNDSLRRGRRWRRSSTPHVRGADRRARREGNRRVAGDQPSSARAARWKHFSGWLAVVRGQAPLGSKRPWHDEHAHVAHLANGAAIPKLLLGNPADVLLDPTHERVVERTHHRHVREGHECGRIR